MPLENGNGAQQMTSKKIGCQCYNHRTQILSTTPENKDVGLPLLPPKRNQL